MAGNMKPAAVGELKKQVTEQKLKGKSLPNRGVKNGQVGAFFKEAKLLRDGEGHPVMRLDFVVVMNDEIAALLPQQIEAEWKYMKAEGLTTEQALNGERIPVQMVEARMWPDKPQAKCFRAVGRLERVKLTEVEDKNSTYIELKVSIRRGKDEDAWHWLELNWPGSSIWLTFVQAQGEVLLQVELAEGVAAEKPLPKDGKSASAGAA